MTTELTQPSASDHAAVTPHVCEYVESYYGHECKACGDFIADGCEPWNDPDHMTCAHCGADYDGGHRCGSCGNGDPEGTGEFDPETGEQW